MIRFQAARDSHRSDALVEGAIVTLGRERLGRDVHRSLGRSEVFEETRNRDDTNIVLALPESGSLLGEDANDRHGMPVNLDDLADGRFVREKIFFDGLADHDDIAREIDVLVRQVAAIGERIGIGREKTLVRTGDRQGRRSFQPGVGALAFEIETLQANVPRDSFHQLLVTKRLGVSDIAPVLVLVRIAPALPAAHRILGELKDVRSEKTDAALD